MKIDAIAVVALLLRGSNSEARKMIDGNALWIGDFDDGKKGSVVIESVGARRIVETDDLLINKGLNPFFFVGKHGAISFGKEETLAWNLKKGKATIPTSEIEVSNESST